MRIITLLLLGLPLFAQKNNLPPAWQLFTVTKIANGTSGCANTNGCWQVNSNTPVNASASTSQGVTLFALPVDGDVARNRIKGKVACSGATTITLDLGTTGNTTLYESGYNLKNATTDTNFSQAVTSGIGSDTANTTNILATVNTSGANVDQIATGCAFTVHLFTGVLP